MTDPEVTALAREREGYARLGNAEGVVLVDEQLRLRGWQVDANGALEPASKSAPKREKRPAAKAAPEKR